MSYLMYIGSVCSPHPCVCVHITIVMSCAMYAQKCLVPASAHGTNAASAEMAGLETIQLKTNNMGGIDMDFFKKEVLLIIIMTDLDF